MSSVKLACVRFLGRHTTDNIQKHYEDTMAKYQISNKVSYNVTDSVSNMLKAFLLNLPGFVSIPGDEQDYDDQNSLTDEEMDRTALDHLPDRIPCFAHTLQLVVKDGLKVADQLTKNLRKTSTIVSDVRKSTLATDLLGGEHCLQTANAIRWNSLLKMIWSVLRVPENKLNSFNIDTKVTTYDRNILSEACDILHHSWKSHTLYSMIRQSRPVL
ncbi:hypothetical protein LSH36_201g05082 [Paralvinella palmiformis]|uniref:Uncharacterized protein n=1 Tax=Paralvinella palmiformis TaxID=53620 RepID=A0AAD9N7I7_9ANNE|nr:hypothetical protein LSH36_201g05082 [Paralvinella palmiformis]